MEIIRFLILRFHHEQITRNPATDLDSDETDFRKGIRHLVANFIKPATRIFSRKL
jgi:hypothetical protein